MTDETHTDRVTKLSHRAWLRAKVIESERRSAELHARLTDIQERARQRHRELRSAYAMRYQEPGPGMCIDDDGDGTPRVD